MRSALHAAVAFLAALALAGTLAACRDPGQGAERDTLGRGRVIVFGIDGADWQVIEPAVKRGALPAFKRLIDEGATGVLRSMEPSASPALWTTIATGVGPERHGIHGFVVGAADEAAADGGGARPRVQPVTSAMRRAPAFWNILPQFEKKVGVVGWLVTWPAEPTNGFIVSSYLPYIYNWSTGRPLKGTIVDGIPNQTFPAGLIDEIDALKVRPADLEGAVRRFYDPERAARLSAGDQECVEGFRWSLACDETYRRIGLRLFDTYPVDLFAVYFGGVDVASHRFWKFAYPDALRYDVGPEERETLGGIIDKYYAWIDEALAEYMERMQPEDTLVVLSDHGFRPVLIPGKPTTSGHHREEGILAIFGRAAARGRRITSATLVDILPTLFTILDVPVSMDLEGHVLREAIDPAFASAHPTRHVDAYAPGGGGAAAAADQREIDENVLERLRSLGYID